VIRFVPMGFSLPLKRKRRRPIKDIERELRVIYHGRDGRIPDLTKLEYQRKSLLTAILIRMSILLLLVFVIGIGFLLITVFIESSLANTISFL